jgi:5-methylcytosine-specific restriction enzyme B
LMSVDSPESLQSAFYLKIIPLLQEYFFGDYGKMGLVLGDGFVKIKANEDSASIFADFDSDTGAEYAERPVYQIIDYRDSRQPYKIGQIEMTFEKAIKRLMKESID